MSKIIYRKVRTAPGLKTTDANWEQKASYYAKAVSLETMSLRDMAKHIASHGSPYTVDVVVGVLEAFRSCCIEQLLESKKVKVEGLGTFYVTIANKDGGEKDIAKFNIATMATGLRLRFLPENAQGEEITSKKFKDQCSLQISIHRRVVVGSEQVVTDVVFEHGDANLSGGLVGGGDGARTHGLVDIGGLVDGVVHLHIDGVGGGEGGQVLWCLAGRTEAIAEEEAYEAGGWNGDVPSHAVA